MFSRFNNLTVKIFTLFWLIFILLVMLAFLIPRFDARLITPLQANDMSLYQREIASSIQNNKFSRLLILSNQLIPDNTGELRPILVDKNGNIIGAKENELASILDFVHNSNEPAKPMQKVFYDIQVVGPFSVHIDSDFESGQRETYLLYFVKYVNPQREVVNFIFDHPLSIVFIIMMITSPLLWWLVWSISEPIKRLQSAANAVALGNFDIDKNLEAHGASELRQVGRSFNRMAQAISELISSHQSLLSSISHELRTPLTRLQLATALLRRRYGNGGEILRIENEAERLNKMINDLLQLSRKQIKNQLLREPFPIDEIWETIMKDARFEASQMNIKCSFKQNIINPGQHRMSGNQEALSSAVENILRNALKYTNTQIEIITYLGNGYLFISVDDDGAGVPPAEYDEIFKPFYRVDTARTRETGGAGLGLTIVQDVVQQHRGRVWAESSPLGGLRVTIQLPLWR